MSACSTGLGNDFDFKNVKRLQALLLFTCTLLSSMLSCRVLSPHILAITDLLIYYDAVGGKRLLGRPIL